MYLPDITCLYVAGLRKFLQIAYIPPDFLMALSLPSSLPSLLIFIYLNTPPSSNLIFLKRPLLRPSARLLLEFLLPLLNIATDLRTFRNYPL